MAGIDALKVIDYSSLTGLVANGITVDTFLTLPKFTFMTAFGAIGEINASYIATIAVAYVPVAFVVFAEHIADHKNISSIIEKDLLEEPGLHRTLLGDGIGSMAGAFFGGCPNTTYGEAVACVAISGNASTFTISTTAVLAVLISFLSPFVAFVNSIPSCVMGGVCVALYGFIAVSGLKMIQKVDLEENKNLFVVSTILICGIGGLTLTFGQVTLTSIACALILGILFNIVLNKKVDK
jgi:uracil permease